MNLHATVLAAAFLATTLFTPAAAPAADFEAFLKEVKFAESTAGISNALAMVEARLQKPGRSATESSRYRLLEAELFAKADRHGEALEIIRDKVMLQKDVATSTKLEGIEIIKTRSYKFLPKLQVLDFVVLAARQPEFARQGEERARICLLLGRIHAERSCHDLAFTAYREAAASLEDPAAKVDAYFEAAAAAQQYRDVKAAAECLAAAEAIPNLPVATRQRIQLALARNAIYCDQHSWQPSREQVVTARRFADQALQANSPLLGTPEALLTLYAIARAEAAAGDLAAAAENASKLIARKNSLDGRTNGDIAVFIADNLHAAGDYKEAVKYYEMAARTGCTLGLKNLHKRIAFTARTGQDYMRAMQGYSDAIRYCDKIEGKDEIAHLTRLVTLMNQTIRKASSSVDAATIFNNTDSSLDALNLD